MEDNIPTLKSLHDLLDYDASKFTSAEIQLLKTIPGWINRASSLKLKAVLQKYRDMIQQHIQKMEEFFEEEKFSSLSLNNRMIQTFIEEAEEKLSICGEPDVKDACLLASIQAINHYKISAFGTAAAFAHTLGMEKHAAIFHEAEVNEKQIDDRLSQLAEHEINIRAKEIGMLPNG